MGIGIERYLASPTKVASVIDWKKATGCILALDIGSDGIGLAIAAHPAFGNKFTQKLDSVDIKLDNIIERKRRVLQKSVVRELEEIVEIHGICSFVVSWPLENSGRCGFPCGKVLHTLDSMAFESSSIFTLSRPVCLWDINQFVPDDDEWGRTPAYANAPKKRLHVASEEQYTRPCSSEVAVDVWNDFCKTHWPEIYYKNKEEDESAKDTDYDCFPAKMALV